MTRKTPSTVTTNTSEYQKQQDLRKPFRDVIHQWKIELGLYEKNNRKRVEDAAFKLWDSGTIDSNEKRKICSMIVHEMREDIIAGRISEWTIINYCPTQFRGRQGPKGPRGWRNLGTQISEQTLPDVLGRTTSVLSGRDLFKTERTPIENVIQESEGHMLSIPIPWSDDALIDTKLHCDYLIPLLRRFREILNDSGKARRRTAEMSSR